MRRLLLTLLLLLGATGCATVPSEGPVRQGQDSVAAATDEPAVRRLAPPPRTGAGPEEIVRGFLLASASTEPGAATARRYLTAPASSTWHPDTGVQVLEGNPTLRAAGSTVRMEGRRGGTLDAASAYRSVDPAEPVSESFEVREDPSSGGEWRIAALPDGRYLPRYEVDRVFRSYSVAFLTPAHDRLVPEPVVLPATEDIASVLITRLLDGPSARLAPATATAVPTGAQLASSVVLRAGTATVDLTTPAAPSGVDRDALLAQVAATLRPLPGVAALRLTLNGATVDDAGLLSPQAVDAFERFSADVLPPSNVQAYGVQSGRVGRLENGGLSALPVSAATRKLTLRSPAISIDGGSMAGISSDGDRLYVGRIGASETLAVRVRGDTLTDASFDADGTVWVLDAGSSAKQPVGPTLWVVGSSGRASRVLLPALDGNRVRELRVSRDGSRIALIARSGGRDRLYVAVLLRTGDAGAPAARISGAVQVAPQFTAVRDVAWRDGSTLAVLAGDPESVTQPYTLSLDGFSSEALSPVPANALTIAAAPGTTPLLVGAEDRVVFQASGRTWRERGRAADPVYPG